MEAFDEHLLKNLAWVFTVLSAVVSIALSVHRFGLSAGKRIAVIIGFLVFGVSIALLFISDYSPLKRLQFITANQAEQIRQAHQQDGDRNSGYEVTDQGVVENSSNASVNRVSEYVYGVIHPDGKITAVYNGGFFDAQIDGRTVSCELIDIGDDRVLIIKDGDSIETINLKSSQADNEFKVQKVPVARRP